MLRVTIVTVSYNSAAVIGRLLDALQHPELGVIVVDNGSTDDSVAIVQSYARVQLIQCKNIGYGRAANLGFAHVNAPYALLLNPDVVITPQAIEAMVVMADRNPNIGLLGAQMFTHDSAGAKQYERQLSFDIDGLCYTDWLVGAAMLIRMDALAKVDGFDDNIFLFYEETDLCKRFIKAGYTLAIVQAAEAQHVAGTSCGTVCSRIHKIKYWHAGWSKAYYTRKYEALWIYALESVARITNLVVKWFKSLLACDRAGARQYYYTLCGTLAKLIGKSAFKNGVGRHT